MVFYPLDPTLLFSTCNTIEPRTHGGPSWFLIPRLSIHSSHIIHIDVYRGPMSGKFQNYFSTGCKKIRIMRTISTSWWPWLSFDICNNQNMKTNIFTFYIAENAHWKVLIIILIISKNRTHSSRVTSFHWLHRKFLWTPPTVLELQIARECDAQTKRVRSLV